jgi:biotin-dependent carboxylase-like uncharacterized protein
MPALIIESPGFFTTVQDQGRYGYQRYGMPVSGAMDTFSLLLANLLVGNSPIEAGLEATYTGPEILFTSAGAVAVCGADMGPLKNETPVQNNKTITVKKGDRLSFSGLKNGCRSFIAISGGIDTPPVMGSRSTYLRGNTGGFRGRILRTGDELPIGTSRGKIPVKEVPGEILPRIVSDPGLRIIPGPESDRIDSDEFNKFLSSEYAVTDQNDRMGYRLAGETIRYKSSGADIISAGISEGTVQIPGNGQPVIMMADRQTTGGYARIANVITVDIGLAAQLKSGNKVHFSKISIEEATELLKNRRKIMKRYFG